MGLFTPRRPTADAPRLSIDLQPLQVLVQRALLRGLGVLERLDLAPQGVELGLLLVELLDVAVGQLGILGQLAQVLADPRLLLSNLADALLLAGPLGAGLLEAAAEL